MKDMEDIDKTTRALDFIDSSDRTNWIRMGGAIKSEYGDSGFEIWNGWSKRASNYEEKSAKSTWRSLKEGRINIASLFYEARKHGYKDINKTYSSQELAKRQADYALIRKKREEEFRASRLLEAKQKEESIKESLNRWNDGLYFREKDCHPYLVNKGINDKKISKYLKQEGANLLVPLKRYGSVVAIQTISPEGVKRFNKNASVKGNFLTLGNWHKAKEKGEILLCEGFATGASLHLATGKDVAVCFTGNNMVEVAKEFEKANIQIYVCADVDRSNAGFRYAEKIKKFNPKAEIIFPEFTEKELSAPNPPSDFNDLAQLRGLEELKTYFIKPQEMEMCL
ncbi:topoisomerase [Taylorella equigenitalis]|nr:putative DNA primase protein [Taylorella equigenitalis ATCC 35865]ASY39615.1 topoisomerase [Taylorella equigenitalis]